MELGNSVLQDKNSRLNATTDFYPTLLENNIFRVVCLTLSVFTLLVGLPFIYSVIWFERYGSDKKRTSLNLLFLKINYINIVYLCFIQFPELLRYTYGPLPIFICHVQYISRSVCAITILLFVDAITATRFIFIFWLKNPAAFHDDFWCHFISLWIFGFSSIWCFSWHYLLQVQSSGFYICTGWQVSKESLSSPGMGIGSLLIMSVVLNIFVYLKIYSYKQKPTGLTLSRSCVAKSVVLKEIEEQSLSSFAAILFGILMTALSFANSLKLNNVIILNFNTYPNYFFAYFRSFVTPALTLILVMILFIGKRTYRHSMSTELNEQFQLLKNKFRMFH
jgi:hypothetical protein